MKTKINSELQLSIDEYKTALANLQQEEVKLESLQVRLSELSSRAVGLQKKGAELEKRKKEALAGFAVGNTEEETLARIRDEASAADRELADVNEMIDAIDTAVNKITAEIPPGSLAQAKKSIERLHRGAWAAVVADVASKAPKGLAEYIERVFVAARQIRGGGAVELPYGLGALNPPGISRERMEELRSELERQYFS